MQCLLSSIYTLQYRKHKVHPKCKSYDTVNIAYKFYCRQKNCDEIYGKQSTVNNTCTLRDICCNEVFLYHLCRGICLSRCELPYMNNSLSFTAQDI